MRDDEHKKEEFRRKYREIKNQTKKVVAAAIREAEKKLHETGRGKKQVYRLAKAREKKENTL